MLGFKYVQNIAYNDGLLETNWQFWCEFTE